MNEDNQQDQSLYWIGRVQCPPAIINGDLHVHEHHELIFIVNGDYYVEIEGKQEHLRSGDFILYPAGVPHRPIHKPDFNQVYVLQWQEENFKYKSYHKGRDTTLRLSVLLHWIWSSFPTKNSDEVSFHRTLLQAILEFCHLEQAEPSDVVQEIEHYLNNINHADVSMDELAAFVNLSPRHLTRIFTEKHGVTPKQYLISLRLEHAMNLLISSHFSLKDVASISGFSSAQHFYRHFKIKYGISPKQYREQNRDIK